MGSLSSPRIWCIPPSVKAGMNQSLQTCIPLVSLKEKDRERNSQKRIKPRKKLGLPGASRTLKATVSPHGIWTEELNGRSHSRRSEL